MNGAILDPSGAAVAGAKITVTNAETGLTRTSESNETGLYSLVRLPVGRYDMTIEKQGFKPTKRTGIQLAVGAILTYDVHMELGAAVETITVIAETPLIESGRSQTSTVINERSVADLPINGRNFLAFAILTPGVVLDPRGGDLSFGGQRGTANSLLIDGGDSNNLFFGQSSGRAGTRNPYSFSTDAVQEFQVNNSGYTADTGRAGGGVINVVTKSGTNTMHGTGFWFYRDKGMNANTFINNSRSIAKQPYHFNQLGGNIGGPVLEDKVFFFFNYEGQRNKNPNPVFLAIAPPADALSQQAAQELQPFLTPYTRNFDNDIYTFKIDWNIGASNNLSVRYNGHRFSGRNLENSGSASALEHTGDSLVKTDNVAANYNHIFSGNMVWDARLIYLRDDEPGQANGDRPEAVIRQGNTTVMQLGRNNFSPRFTNSKKYQTLHGVSHTRGRHTFKVGGDLNFERIQNFFPGLFAGSYTFNSYADFAARRPFTYSQSFAGNSDGPLTRPHIGEYAFYLQDTWRVRDRLTLNYGLRYDLMNSADPKVANPNQALAAAGLNTARMNLDTNNWAPRFGFAYKLLASGKLLARGGYGIFYGRTPAIMTGTAHSNNGVQVLNYVLQSNLPAYPAVLSSPPASGAATPSIFVYAPDYVQPLTHQYSLNVEYAFARNSIVTVGYLGVRGQHLSHTRDINLFPAEPVSGRFVDNTPVTYLRHPGTSGPARPNPAFGRISLFDSGADATYHGGFVQLTKRYSRNFQMLTSYTWSKVIDTVPTQVAVVVGTDDAQGVQNTLQPNADRGPGDANVKHRFVFSTVWDLPYGRSLSNPALRAVLRDYQFSLISSVSSGRWFSATVASDPNNNGQTPTDRSPGVGRNTIEGPGFAAVDVRFSRDISLRREGLKLHLIFEAFNLTNRSNFSNFNRGQYNFTAFSGVFTPRTDYLLMTGSADPRILQLAAKISF